MDLTAELQAFAVEVGTSDPVTITGTSSRGGPIPRVRAVRPPAGIEWVQADEMTASCGAATLVAELDEALAEFGQCVALPAAGNGAGTVGGALAVGRSGIRRLGYGPARDVLLQARCVGASGELFTAGGPTVKNVSGFDLCRLLVGSRGTLAFIGSVIVRTRPLPAMSQWYRTDTDAWEVLASLYRPTSVLWDGTTTWVLLEGHPDDVAAQAGTVGLNEASGPPPLPTTARWSVAPSELRSLAGSTGFVAEIGVGVVHHSVPASAPAVDPAVVRLHQRIKHQFDPAGRLNPGLDVLEPDDG